MDSLRVPFLVVAVVAFLLVVLIEVGSLAYLGTDTELPTPGIGIPMLAMMDGIVFFTLGLMALALVIPGRVFGVVQGIVTFLTMLLAIVGGIALVFVAIGLLILMVTLLMAVPFGTAVYFATYADFAVNAARATLGSLVTLKIIAVVCLFLAQQRFLKVKGLVFLMLSSFLAGLIVSVLHAIAPGPLVSITDAIAAIVVGVISLIWACVKLFGAIPGIVKGLRVDRHLT